MKGMAWDFKNLHVTAHWAPTEQPPQTPEGCGRMVAAEYWAYRYFCAGLASVKEFEALEKRCRAKLPKAWSMYKCAVGMLEKVQDIVRLSFTPEERMKIRREMDNDKIKLFTSGPAHQNFEDDDYMYLSRSTVMWLVGYVAESECNFCERRGDKCKRCPTKQQLDKIFTHRVPTESRGACLWAQYADANGAQKWNDMTELEWDPDDDVEVIGEKTRHHKDESEEDE